MQNLRALRRSRSLTFLDLAALTGIPARQIAEIEYGLRRLSPPERESLAVAFGLAPGGFTGAHRRVTVASASLAPAAERRALHVLMVAALAATLATSAVTVDLSGLRLPTLPAVAALTGAPAPAETAAPDSAAPSRSLPAAGLGAGAIGRVAPAPVAEEAAAIGQLVDAILELRAALPEVALSPELLVGVTPPESVAPAPMPVIEVAPPYLLTDAGPLGCPVKPTAGRVIMTQGYGVGSHAPAETWGAVDLAVEGDSWYQPIVATHDGHVTVTLDSYPAGNHVWVNEPGGVWRTGYSHLAIVTVASGQFVRAGEQIGLLGSSGVSSGPHLDYQVWRGGVNIDPTKLVGC
jgi:murein DD-endopeptidase MepM/ murein hydrolase activator NlpD